MQWNCRQQYRFILLLLSVKRLTHTCTSPKIVTHQYTDWMWLPQTMAWHTHSRITTHTQYSNCGVNWMLSDPLHLHRGVLRTLYTNAFSTVWMECFPERWHHRIRSIHRLIVIESMYISQPMLWQNPLHTLGTCSISVQTTNTVQFRYNNNEQHIGAGVSVHWMWICA